MPVMPKKKKKSSRIHGNYQGSINVDSLQPRILSVRCCPFNVEHIVHGNCFYRGGRKWYCSDCGVEWIASLRTNSVRYLRLNEDGSADLFKTIPLDFFNEFRQLQEKTAPHLAAEVQPNIKIILPTRMKTVHYEQLDFSFNTNNN